MLDVFFLSHIFWVVYRLLTWASLSRGSKSLQIPGFQSQYWNDSDLTIPWIKYIEKQYSSVTMQYLLIPGLPCSELSSTFFSCTQGSTTSMHGGGKFWHIRSFGRGRLSVLHWSSPPHSIFLFLLKKPTPLILFCYLASNPKHVWYVRKGYAFTSRKPIQFPKLEIQIQQSIS